MESAPLTSEESPRRLRFGMVYLFAAMGVGVLLFTVVGGWYAEFRGRTYAQRTVDKLKGKHTTYNDGFLERVELEFPPLDEQQVEWLAPAWKYQDNVTRLKLEDSAVYDKDVPAILEMPNLKALQLDGTEVGDASMAQLRLHTPLGGWQELDLARTRITDGCATDLAQLTSLVELSLAETQVTDATLAQLPALEHLEKLNLAHCPITDEGLYHIRELERLVELDLRHTPITDEGLAHLKRLPRLTKLHLSHTAITEGAIISLRRLPQLKEVDLMETGLDAAAQERLKRQMPELTIATESSESAP